ncbi:MAG: tetratricopeptide repeat protein [Pseudomonadota bacterium]
MTPETPAKGFPIRRLAMLLITAAVLASYSNSFSVPFLYDDVPNIVESRSVRSLMPLTGVLFPPPGSHVGGRPLLNLSFAVNYAISGLSVWSYHVFNLLVHLLAALALFGLVRRTLARPPLAHRFGRHADLLALAIALLWAVHPLHTEAVTYITQRAESMMGLFLILTLYSALRGWESARSWPWHLAATGAMIVGGAAKEVMVVAPFLVLGFDMIFVHPKPKQALKSSPVLYAGLLVALALLVAQVAAGDTSRATPNAASTPFGYLVTQTTVIVHYLQLAFWPSPLVFDYGWAEASLGRAWPQALFLTILFAATAWAAFRRRPAGFAGLWFFFILAPTSSIMPLPFYIWERRMYLPLAAVAAVVVLGGYRLILWATEKSRDARTRKRLAAAGLAFVLAAAAALGAATFLRNRDFRSEMTIWQDTVEKRPQNSRGHTALGTALERQGRTDEAMEQYRIATTLDPPSATAFHNLGATLARMGRKEESVEYFRRALEIHPMYGEAHANFAGVLADLSLHEEALRHAGLAVAMRPDYAPGWFNLGTVLAKEGKTQEALDALARTLDLDPALVEARVNLAMILLEMKRPRQALIQAQKALEEAPGQARIPLIMGQAYTDLGEYARARAAFIRTLALAPGSLPAFLGLARAAESAGHPDQAEMLYDRAMEEFPHNPEVLLKMGIFFLRQEREEEAMASFEKALAVRPDYAPAHTNLGVALLLSGNREKALEHFRRAMELTPMDAGVFSNVGITLAQMGRLGEAARYLQRALVMNPDLPQARVYLDRILQKPAAGN